MSRLLDNLLLFGRILRRAGIAVHPGRLLDVVAALDHVDLASRDEVYYACRALLVHRPEQMPIFDRAFAAFWSAQTFAGERSSPPRESTANATAAAELIDMAETGQSIADDDAEDGGTTPGALRTWSEAGGLADKDFAILTPAELAQATAALARLIWTPGQRRTRRWIRGRGPRLDLRRAIADSRRTGGDVVTLSHRVRRTRPRPLVLLCDISGSMERYSRLLTHFAYTVASRYRRVETFFFARQLTRVTRQLDTARPDEALTAVSRVVPEWSGGTQIGRAIREFHRRWASRTLTGGAVVLLVSDGWDCGDPAELATQIARLQRSAHRLVWLNPLVGTVGYAPLTRGLRAALPFVDDFLPARTLNDLADLAVHLNTLA